MEGATQRESIFSDIGRALYGSNDSIKVNKLLNILHKVVENIVSHPTDTKYQKLKHKNNSVKKNILPVKCVKILLNALNIYERNVEIEVNDVDISKQFKVLPRENVFLLTDLDINLMKWFLAKGNACLSKAS